MYVIIIFSASRATGKCNKLDDSFYKILFLQEYDCFLKMISVCGVVQVPTVQDQQHWRVDKFQHLLAHFSDQVTHVAQLPCD